MVGSFLKKAEFGSSWERMLLKAGYHQMGGFLKKLCCPLVMTVWEREVRLHVFLCSLQTLRFPNLGILSTPQLSRSVGYSAENIFFFCYLHNIEKSHIPAKKSEKSFLICLPGKKQTLKFRVSIGPLLNEFSAPCFEAGWDLVENTSSDALQVREAENQPSQTSPHCGVLCVWSSMKTFGALLSLLEA